MGRGLGSGGFACSERPHPGRCRRPARLATRAQDVEAVRSAATEEKYCSQWLVFWLGARAWPEAGACGRADRLAQVVSPAAAASLQKEGRRRPAPPPDYVCQVGLAHRWIQPAPSPGLPMLTRLRGKQLPAAWARACPAPWSPGGKQRARRSGSLCRRPRLPDLASGQCIVDELVRRLGRPARNQTIGAGDLAGAHLHLRQLQPPAGFLVPTAGRNREPLVGLYHVLGDAKPGFVQHGEIILTVGEPKIGGLGDQCAAVV